MYLIFSSYAYIFLSKTEYHTINDVKYLKLYFDNEKATTAILNPNVVQSLRIFPTTDIVSEFLNIIVVTINKVGDEI